MANNNNTVRRLASRLFVGWHVALVAACICIQGHAADSIAATVAPEPNALAVADAKTRQDARLPQ